jgi:hypothetical protein
MTNPSKAISKEILFIVLTVLCTIVITVLATVSGAKFDVTRISSTEALTNILLNTSITLLMLIVAIPYGKVHTMCKKIGNTLGRYLTSFSNFDDISKKIAPKTYQFEQWHDIKYKKEVASKQYRYLSEKGIRQTDFILKLDRTQIEALTEPRVYKIDGNDVWFCSLTKSQIKACLKVYDGKITLHKLPDQYFLFIDGKSSNSFYEQAYYEKRMEALYTFHKVFSKVAIGLAISCILTSLILDAVVFDNATLLKIFINLFARLLTIVLNLFNGFTIGQELIYKKCYYIDGKTQTLTEFNEDVNFVYKNPQELAKQEFLERSSLNETKDQK